MLFRGVLLMAISHNCAVVYRNLVDDATVTASSSVAGISPDRVKSGFVAAKWRSTANSATLDFDLGAGGVSIDSLWIGGLTATSARFYLDEDDDTFASPDEDSGAITVDQINKSAVYLLETAVTRRYLRIALSHSSLAYVEAGRAVAGARSTFGYNFAYGGSITPVDPSPRSVTLGSGVRKERRPGYRMVDLPFEWLSQADREGFVETMVRENGQSVEMLLLLDPAHSNLPMWTIWALMENAPPLSWAHPETFSAPLSFREQL